MASRAGKGEPRSAEPEQPQREHEHREQCRGKEREDESVLQLLRGGRVGAYVSLFYMSNNGWGVADGQPSASELQQKGVDPEREAEPERVPLSLLPQCERLLAASEDAARSSDPELRYRSLAQLASNLSSNDLPRKALFVRSQALLAAKDAADPSAELSAHASLGELHEHIGSTASAVEHYERHRRLAELVGHPETLSSASASLLRACRLRAQELSSAGDHASCTRLLYKCTSLASDLSEGSQELARAYHELGRALQAQHRFEKALEQFNQEASLAQAAALDDIVAQARYAMAEVQKELGKFDAASESLQKFFELGNTSEQRAQADAYCLKGMLEVQQGKFDESLKSFEVFFEVARAMNDQTLLDAARINLGVVRGHLRHESYMSLVANDMSSLLNWKLTREKLPSLEDVEQQQPPPREQQQQITTCG